jgi:hypothetical protein
MRRAFAATLQGGGFLDWKQPVDGAAAAPYKIEHRKRPAGEWTLISLALESEATLNNQQRGKDWEYRTCPQTGRPPSEEHFRAVKGCYERFRCRYNKHY